MTFRGAINITARLVILAVGLYLIWLQRIFGRLGCGSAMECLTKCTKTKTLL